METIIVEICIAATGNISDFMLPAHIKTSSLIQELVRLVEQAYQEITYGEEPTILCSLTDGSVIAGNLTLAQAGIRDGHRLMLV